MSWHQNTGYTLTYRNYLNDRPRRAPIRYYVGLDLAQLHDHTALAVARRVPPEDWDDRKTRRGRPEGCTYEILTLKHYPIGTRYPDIVAEVEDLMSRSPLNDRSTILAVDATGVGLPVVNSLEESRLRPYAITITGGSKVNQTGSYSRAVPKMHLISTVQVLLQDRRLKIAGRLLTAMTLQREIRNYRVKVEGSENMVSWREHKHDDLLFAVALACWAGENLNRPRVMIW